LMLLLLLFLSVHCWFAVFYSFKEKHFNFVGDGVPCVTGQSRDFGASISPKIRLPHLAPNRAYIGNREMSDKLRNEL
jgi:hypothetical protein